ncbi:uncharacterized protein [Temnothorax longispinosus]|uniref:uncharacterized protein n=1 Tax=Temnothorax longispinosus TaxID=300112 RepID=UPI003A99DAE1
MYHAVIISCLIAVGCAGIVSPGYHANRETRQATTASTNPAQNNNFYYMQGFPDPTAPAPTGTSLAETEDSPSFLSRLKPYLYEFFLYSKYTSNYLLQSLGAVFLTTSAAGLICSYTSVCTYLKLAALEQSEGRRRRMVHSYSPNEYPYLNELTEIFMRAMDNYALDNVKQTREVGQ